jgi:hypothetical protein
VVKISDFFRLSDAQMARFAAKRGDVDIWA